MRVFAFAIAPAALLLAGAAAAQSYGQQGYGQQSYAQPGYAPPSYSSNPQGYRDQAERPERAERPETPDPSQDLVRQLNLRGDQQAAFRDYQSAFQAQDQDKDDGQDDVARLAAMTTPQRLDDSARQMDRDRADFERVASATRRFYATLDPGQKRTFDRLTAPRAEPDEDADAGPGGRDPGGRDDHGRGPSRPPAPQR